MHVQPGQRIAHYEVVRELARGGQGVVCEARHVALGGAVALKLLSDRDPGATARFQREARTLRRLKHPNLLRVEDLGELSDGVAYMAMELIRGSHLKAWVEREGLPPLERVVEVLTTLAETLDHCHEQGLVHRDVKPRNVLLEEGTGRLVLVDFGLVRRRKLELAWTTQDDRSLTQDGTVLGTPAYMAPEQVSTEYGEIDRRTDVYALGGVMYYLLTGHAPFEGASAWNVLVKVMSKPPRDPRELRAEVPGPIAELCLQCLAKDPGARPMSARVFAEELSRLGGEHAAERRPSGSSTRTWLAGLALLAVPAVGVALAVASGTEEPTSSSTPATAATPSATPSPTPSTAPTARPKTSQGDLVAALRRAAESGDVKAMIALAGRLDTGRGVPRDVAEAVRWYRRAAEAGSRIGMSALGTVYLLGRGGVARDLGLAEDWLRRAAAAGHPPAQRHLGGLLLQSGKPSPSRVAEAVGWLRRAAEQNDAPAMVDLARCLVEGRGVSRDPAAAVRWFRRAAERGHGAGMYGLGVSYFQGLGVPRDEAEALRWYRRGAAAGHAGSMTGVGHMYMEGRSVPKDPAQALRWYRKAAELKDPTATFRVGLCYMGGQGVVRDTAQASRWLRQAVQRGHVGALSQLGRLLAETDPKAGVSAFRTAAERGDPHGMLYLGQALLDGVGGPRDLAEAERWLRLAAANRTDPSVRSQALGELRRLGGSR